MANDVKEFIERHDLKNPILMGHSMYPSSTSAWLNGQQLIHSRGAKVAMTLCLREPKLPAAMISVDNAPVVLPVGNEFLRYIQGMRDIQNSKIMKRVEADHIMERYEKVCGDQMRLWDYQNQKANVRLCPVLASTTVSPHQPHSTPRVSIFSVPDSSRYPGIQSPGSG